MPRVPSTGGKYKSFSHLAGVCLFYGIGLGVYLSSATSQSLSFLSTISPASFDAVALVVCTVVTPMLNPFIYSLRNRDIKRGHVVLTQQNVLILVTLAHLECGLENVQN